ncbi:MAG: hypothetical protein JW791_01165 [Nanoarchaeota archaeon]|nr:hypothetical protein [Nanoarchaeota archaeon]
MKKSILILISVFMLLTILNNGFSVKCAKNLQGSDGTCIDKTYNMLFSGGETAYYACSSYVDPTLWYYETCTATAGTGTITSEEGNVVAEYWSNDAGIVSACAGHDGLYCNVQPIFGFQTDTNLPYVGYCDSSEENCVKCSASHTEFKQFNGSLPQIIGAGNNLCESGCGAEDYCDEVAQISWSNNSLNASSHFEAFCNNVCGLGDTRCRYDFEASINCDYKDPGEVCNTDSCDANNRLIDYNGNGASDSVSCDSSCGCDATPDTLLCDSICGASSNCHRQDIGFNNGNAGCNNLCTWLECNYYAWDTASDSCYSSCTSDSQCYSPAVCDLTGAGINTCTIDSTAPVITALTPLNDSRFNTGEISYSFSVTDNTDLSLDCSYNLNGVNVSLGSVNNGATYSNNIVLTNQNWYELYFTCTDDSGSTGNSNSLFFLYDYTFPTYTNLTYIDETWTVDGSLLAGDVIRVSAEFTDNFELDYGVLWYRVSGGWNVGPTVDLSGASDEVVFYFDTSGYGGQTLQFRIRVSDTAGNVAMSDALNVDVHVPNSDISVTLREGFGNVTSRLEFSGTAQAVTGKKADDSVSTALLGDFEIRHVGIGTMIQNRLSLNNALPIGVQIKVSNNNNPATAVYLTTSSQVMPFCNTMLPGNTCQVWVWMDMTDTISPVLNVNRINVESEIV